MPIYEITLTAQVTERVTVKARDEDAAFELAERIVRGGTIDCDDLEWEWTEYMIGSEHDLMEV